VCSRLLLPFSRGSRHRPVQSLRLEVVVITDAIYLLKKASFIALISWAFPSNEVAPYISIRKT
jgi:hypothetical protein